MAVLRFCLTFERLNTCRNVEHPVPLEESLCLVSTQSYEMHCQGIRIKKTMMLSIKFTHVVCAECGEVMLARARISTCVLFSAYAASTTAPTAADTSSLLLAAMATMMLLAASVNSVLEFELATSISMMAFVVSTPSCRSTKQGLRDLDSPSCLDRKG